MMPARKVKGPLAARLRRIVQQKIKAALERAAAKEAADWERCFGNGAPADPELKLARIVRVASTRALLSMINRPDPA